MEKIFTVYDIESKNNEKMDKNAVYLENTVITEIFNNKFKSYTDRRYLKIKNTKNKKSIYRIVRSGNSQSTKKDEMYVSYDGKIKLFGEYDVNTAELKIKKCSGTAYCLHHPDYFCRVSFIWAFIASVVGLISFVFSILSFFK